MTSRLLSFVSTLLIISSLTAQEGPNTKLLNDLKFRSIGPATMSGRVVDLAVDSKDSYKFYVATATGGIWKTKNNGISFDILFDQANTHSIGDIALHDEYTQHLWVGTGERANRQSNSWGDGVYHSTDGGKTWKHKGLKDSHHIGRIALHPKDTNIVYVAAMGHLWGPNAERGLYKSVDGGSSWQNILFIDENTGVSDVAIDPSNPEIIYAATYQRQRKPYGFHGGGPGSGIFKSTDAGKNWKELTEGLPEGDYGRIGISIYQSNPEIVYISVEQGFQYNASTAYGKRKAGVYRSEDKGESWKFMSDWNPRPMYASQILVDPSDDQRIYMMNSYSYSDDGGKTFRRARQSLHGDDRILWVDPNNSKHVIKGDDGGLGISYDRGLTWLYATHIPVSQFYRVSVDMRDPYMIYGGLQDNGSWMGPSETYVREGIQNSDWIKTGGGDGFLNLIHPADENILFLESQYLGLVRMDLRTMQTQDIRPGDPKGHISARRNWDAFGPNLPEPELGNAMAPANWDGPFIISSHKPHKLYAGTNQLWLSDDMGNSWKSLGKLTTNVNRRELTIMDQEPDSLTASLDDGIPYYPTLTVIEESPIQQGWLMIGTDDGQIQVSEDGGDKWKEISKKFKGLPDDVWINDIVFSSHNKEVIYLVANNYRNNDFANYVYRSDNGGKKWSLIVDGLPNNRVARTLVEDPKNGEVLYLATELGLFISWDKGENWQIFKANLPTIAINDLVVHPRDNDLILGTHGRGIWILDHLTAIQEMDKAVLSKKIHLFSAQKTRMIDYSRAGAHKGDMVFEGENPRYGAVIDYYIGDTLRKNEVKFEISNNKGELITDLEIDTVPGIHRLYWNYTGEGIDGPKNNPNDSSRRNRSERSFGIPGMSVDPGTFTAALSIGDQKEEVEFVVENDPRISISETERLEWRSFLSDSRSFYSELVTQLDEVYPVKWKMEELKAKKIQVDSVAKEFVQFRLDQYEELQNRTRSLYWAVSSYQGTPTADQYAQLDYFKRKLKEFEEDEDKRWSEAILKINSELAEENKLPDSGN